MGFDVLSSVADLAGKVLDRVLPDQAQKAAAIQKLAELQQSGELARLAAETNLALGQIDINKIEAASPLTFISGWRPAVGWVCVAAVSVQYVLGPLLAWGAAVLGRSMPIPNLDLSALMPILLGILGLMTGSRTIEKIKGVASK